MLKKLSRQLNKFWYQFRVLWNTKSIDRLLKDAGVDVSPEESTWGILNKAEEDIVLARLYGDKLWVALMRKYAEGANKAMINTRCSKFMKTPYAFVDSTPNTKRIACQCCRTQC